MLGQRYFSLRPIKLEPAARQRNGTLFTGHSPVTTGETVSVICTGRGRVTPAISRGLAAPDPPPSTVGIPEVTIGACRQRKDFSGLVPGYDGVSRGRRYSCCRAEGQLCCCYWRHRRQPRFTSRKLSPIQ